MEDQPTDSSDLTADLTSGGIETTEDAPKRRHRLPRQKQLRALQETSEPETAEPENAGPESADEAVPVDSEVPAEESTGTELVGETVVVPTESVEAPREPAAVPPRRRWNPFRRKMNDVPAPEPVEPEPVEPEPVDDAPVPRTPVGKSARTPKAETDDSVDSDGTPKAETDDSVDSDGAPITETDDSDETTDETPVEEPILLPHRPAGKRLKLAAVAASALFVAGGAFVGAAVQPVVADRAMVETKLDIARTAQSAITTLWSYTPENMDTLAQRSAGYLTGDLATEYRKFIDSIAATNKQAQVTNNTQVLATAVESASPTEATALVFTNSVATSPVSKNIPSLRYLSYRLEMKRDRSDWRITRMTTVTSLDLTPQL